MARRLLGNLAKGYFKDDDTSERRNKYVITPTGVATKEMDASFDKAHLFVSNLIDGADAHGITKKKTGRAKTLKQIKGLPKPRLARPSEDDSDMYDNIPRPKQDMTVVEEDLEEEEQYEGSDGEPGPSGVRTPPGRLEYKQTIQIDLADKGMQEFSYDVDYDSFENRGQTGVDGLMVSTVDKHGDGELAIEISEKMGQKNPLEEQLEEILEQTPVTPMDVFADHIGIDMVREPQLHWIVEEAFNAPLAPEWKTYQLPNSAPLYFNLVTGQMTVECPLVAFYRALVKGVKNKAATQIQKLARRRLAMLRLQLKMRQNHAAIMIQKHGRKLLAIMNLERLKRQDYDMWLEMKENRAAYAIQGAFRYYMFRQKLQSKEARLRFEQVQRKNLGRQRSAVRTIEMWFLNWKKMMVAKAIARMRRNAVRRIQRAVKNWMYNKHLETRAEVLDKTVRQLEEYLRREQLTAREHESRLRDKLKQAQRLNQHCNAKLNVARAVADEFARANAQLVSAYNNMKLQTDRAETLARERTEIVEKLKGSHPRYDVPTISSEVPPGDKDMDNGKGTHGDITPRSMKTLQTSFGNTTFALGGKTIGNNDTTNQSTPNLQRRDSADSDQCMTFDQRPRPRKNEAEGCYTDDPIDKLAVFSPFPDQGYGAAAGRAMNASNDAGDQIAKSKHLDATVYREWLTIVRDVELVATSNVRNNLDAHGRQFSSTMGRKGDVVQMMQDRKNPALRKTLDSTMPRGSNLGSPGKENDSAPVLLSPGPKKNKGRKPRRLEPFPDQAMTSPLYRTAGLQVTDGDESSIMFDIENELIGKELGAPRPEVSMSFATTVTDHAVHSPGGAGRSPKSRKGGAPSPSPKDHKLPPLSQLIV